MGYLTIVSSRWGWASGMATIVGVTAGLTVYLLASVFGLAEIVLHVRWLFELLRWAGVAYLIWLAWDTWRGEDGVAAEDERRPGAAALMARGFLANVLNPKVAVFYIALLPGFTDPERNFAGQALILGLIHIGVSVVIHTGIVTAGARASRLLGGADSKAGRAAFALALLAIALWLAWDTRA